MCNLLLYISKGSKVPTREEGGVNGEVLYTSLAPLCEATDHTCALVTICVYLYIYIGIGVKKIE